MPRRHLPLVPLLALLSACAASPVMYPNDALQSRGAAAAEQAVADCLQAAERDGAQGGQPGVVAQTAGGAVIGAVVGGAVGSVFGEAGDGARAGAAQGGATGLMRGVFGRQRPSPLTRRYVERCLDEQGYEVIGWR